MSFVVDASLALAWVLDDPPDPRAEPLLDRLAGERGLVPQIWHHEVRNALLMAERRGRLGWDEALARLALLGTLPLETDAGTDAAAAMALARAHRLSYYDALYLELALRRGAALASLDRDLARAAAQAGIATLEG